MAPRWILSTLLTLSANRETNVHSDRTEKPPVQAVFLCPRFPLGHCHPRSKTHQVAISTEVHSLSCAHSIACYSSASWQPCLSIPRFPFWSGPSVSKHNSTFAVDDERNQGKKCDAAGAHFTTVLITSPRKLNRPWFRRQLERLLWVVSSPSRRPIAGRVNHFFYL